MTGEGVKSRGRRLVKLERDGRREGRMGVGRTREGVTGRDGGRGGGGSVWMRED